MSVGNDYMTLKLYLTLLRKLCFVLFITNSLSHAFEIVHVWVFGKNTTRARPGLVFEEEQKNFIFAD